MIVQQVYCWTIFYFPAAKSVAGLLVFISRFGIAANIGKHFQISTMCFTISIQIMEEERFYQKPWFYFVSRAVFTLALYGGVVWYQWRKAAAAGEVFNYFTIFGDMILLFALGLLWLAFFAQFVLPVQTFEERQQIFDRLMGYMAGSRGPAIFIKNGQAIDRPGESERGGPGVLWLDSASAVVTHINVSFRNTFGPGVHFTGGGEKIAATVDLHNQSQNIGPREKDLPFNEQGSTPEEEYKEVQKRRTMTTAWTRDGIEVVPNISVTFRIDADPVRGEQPGSHFGYREDAVTRAIINQAVNPNVRLNTVDYNVAWNELPACLAADLWREFMGHYRLMQLFEPNCVMPMAIPLDDPLPAGQDTEALNHPITMRDQGGLGNAVTEMLHEINRWLDVLVSRCEQEDHRHQVAVLNLGSTGMSGGGVQTPETAPRTALQVINFMIRERLTNPRSPLLDQNGERLPGWQESREYKILKERGVRVLSVNVSNLRFPPKVEDQLINRWTANWLANARREKDRIASLRQLATLTGQEQAIQAYTDALYRNMVTTDDQKNTLKALLTRMRNILIRNDRAHRSAASELKSIAEMLQWLEEN